MSFPALVPDGVSMANVHEAAARGDVGQLSVRALPMRLFCRSLS
jgi:hypothetical protein